MKTTRRVHRRPADPKPEMTPMIDVTFLLLIFFMLTIQFRTLEGVMGAQLPKDVGAGRTAEEPVEKLRIRIDVRAVGTRLAPDRLSPWEGSGPFAFGPDRVTEWSVGPWKTRDPRALVDKLRALRRLEPDLDAVLDARAGTIYAEAVTALDAARAAGWSTVSFAAAR